MMAVQSKPGGVSLAWLLEGVETLAGANDVDITGLQTDSRAVRPGDLFLACRGLTVHGLEFAGQAVARGACAVLWEPAGDDALAGLAAGLAVPAIAVAGLSQRLGALAARFYAEPSRDMHVIGVTGTDGKTSVTHFVAQALSAGGAPCGLLGTLGYGVYGALQPPTHTTPDALRLQGELAQLHDAGVRAVAMEVSSHALHQGRVGGVAFNTAVLTQLSRDHLDYHGSVEAYAEAKRRLFAMPALETAVLNVGDAFGRSLATQLKDRVQVIAYGRRDDRPARFSARWIELRAVTPRARGLHLELATSAGDALLESSLLGDFNADNLMAALGALLAAGETLEHALGALARVRTVAGRMELFALGRGPAAVVDYAHTPRALESALRALRAHCGGELICVFGAGGERDTGKRALMGAAAERHADRVIVTSDNPRGEDPQAIIDDICAGFVRPQAVQCVADRAAAIDLAIAEAAVDDLVLVAGKGHEDYQQIGDRRLAFSDRVHVQRVLRERAE